jgi:hypothetical protein
MKNQRQSNAMSLSWILSILAFFLLFILAALIVVVNRNRITALADQQRRVEQECRLLGIEITGLERKINNQLLDAGRMQKVLEEKGLQLQKLSEDAKSIIYLNKGINSVAQTTPQQP